MRRALIVGGLLCLLVPAAAFAARTVLYQGYSSQGFEIKFRRSSAGVFRMSVKVRANCQNSTGQNQGDYDFTSRATDTNADPVKRGRFTTKLPGGSDAPDVIITGRFNARGTGRGTMTASGHGQGPNGEDLGTCKSPEVRWTAAP